MPLQPAFTLNSNEIFGSLANMIISQEVFADNIGKHQTLVDKARVDGSLYGDKKLYYATDVLASAPWGADAEMTNLLAPARPAAPRVQALTLDVFRQISLTVDEYLSKRAWSNESAFGQFMSVMLGWIRTTKRVYEGTLYNCFIGTTEAAGSFVDENGNTIVNPENDQSISCDITNAVGSATGIEAAQLEATEIARCLADLIVKMGDYSRAYNDYGMLRSYSDEVIKVVWNADFVNRVKKVDLPTIFHKEGLVDKFEQEVLPGRYFGTVNSAATAGDGATVRSLVEQIINSKHYFPGDLIASGDTAPAGSSYTASTDVICKVLVKLPPMLSAFEAGTSFFNAKALNTNHYLTWGHNTLEYLKNYPFITIKAI